LLLSKVCGEKLLFAMQKRNVPFPRLCGTTGNDAQKLHAPVFAAFPSAARMHGVLCHHITALPIRQELFAPAPRCESEDAPDVWHPGRRVIYSVSFFA
jgi:hypothetical protein